MPAQFVVAVFALALSVGGLVAQPVPKPADDKTLVTKVYNIKPLIGQRGKASGVADADAIIKVIFEAVPQMRELKSGTDGPQIVERDGGRLEVRATAARHADIADLLDAIERLQDIAVVVKADVYELDAAEFAKFQKALPKGKTNPPVLLAIGEEADELVDFKAAEGALEGANKILKAGRLVQTSNGRLVNGAKATLAARQTVVTFHNQLVNNKSAEPPQFVKEGFQLVGLPVVSADRRFVRFKLTEQSVVVTRIKRVDHGEVMDKQHLVLQSAVTEDLGATGSAVVADRGMLIFRLAYAPKDKVWVVVLKPTIFIRAEADELKKQEKK